MAVQRPSWVLNFKLKFDESLTVTTEPDAESVDERLANPSAPIAFSKPQPLITQQGADNVTFVMQRVPKAASMEKPGYRQAGKWSATLDFTELPIDPRTISAASVEIHIGAVSDDDFARGMAGRNADNSLSSVLRTRTDIGVPNESTMRMIGIVDEWEVTHDGEGSIVEMSGRDMRGVLLDTPINVLPKTGTQLIESLDLSKPIDDVVTQILAFNPLFNEFTVIVNPSDWPKGVVPAPAAPDLIPRHRKGARGKNKSGRGTTNSSSSGNNLNFWDLIVRFCYLVGGIPYMDSMGRLNIRPAATVYDKIRGPIDPVANPTPFRGGQPRGTDFITGRTLNPPLRSRRLVFGRDVEANSFVRKFGGWRRPKTVRAISLNPDSTAKGSGKVLVGIFPPEGTHPRARKTKRSPGKGKPLEEIVNIPVPGITSVDRLTAIAESIYNEIGRGEVGGSITTKNLSSFGGTSGSDPDLLRLEPGDGVELLVDTRSVRSGSPLVSEFTDHNRRSFDDQVKRITEKLGNADLARVIVATARGQINQLQRFFRVQNVKFTWTEAGISISFDYQNYIVANADVQAFDFNDEPLVVTPDETFDFSNDPLQVVSNERYDFTNEALAVKGRARTTTTGTPPTQSTRPTLRRRG